MFEVRAECLEGGILVLRRFATREEAEDHPVTMAYWKRVWVQEADPAPVRDTISPPLPWRPEWRGKRGYILDANGKALISLLGTPERQEHAAKLICSAVNEP